VTGIFEMIRQAASGQGRSYVYHGFSVRLPPEVHALVHDPSLPEHVRGFHLARHLLTRQPGDYEIAHSGDMLGQDWHRDSYYASMAAKARGGVAPGRTPYVLKALEPYPLWLHAGSPVHFTGLYWHHPEAQVPGSPHEGDEHELDFPEPVTGRA
jgi:hypothetical protein